MLKFMLVLLLVLVLISRNWPLDEMAGCGYWYYGYGNDLDVELDAFDACCLDLANFGATKLSSCRLEPSAVCYADGL